MEFSYNKQHYVEDHPPFTRRPRGDHAIADESQETDRHVDPLDQWYEDVTEMPETPGQRGAKGRSDEQKYEDTEASERRIEVPETPGQRRAKRRSDEQMHEDTEASESRIEGTCTLDNSLRKMKKKGVQG